MATYNGARRAPNVSQYIANLNTIPTPQDAAEQAEFDITNDSLDFLNTEFFDFDASAFDANNAFVSQPQSAVSAPQPLPSNIVAAPGEANFQYAEFQGYPQHTFSQSPASMTQTPAATYPQEFTSASSGDKRTAVTAQLQPLPEVEDQSRFAAEEDKRRRNTAASARFRVKKKQREQALEKQAKEMTDKVSQLENKVQQLELENKWLKGLITEKSDTKGMEEQFRKYVAERKAEDKKAVETKASARNDGVGTKLDA